MTTPKPTGPKAADLFAPFFGPAALGAVFETVDGYALTDKGREALAEAEAPRRERHSECRPKRRLVPADAAKRARKSPAVGRAPMGARRNA